MPEADNRDELIEQLQTALDSRVIVEQAKGVLSEQGAVGVAKAFDTLRAYARRTQRLIDDVAADVVERRLIFSVLKRVR